VLATTRSLASSYCRRILPCLPLVGAYFLRPRRPTEIKLDTYECVLGRLAIFGFSSRFNITITR